jgi:hypothetical protein
MERCEKMSVEGTRCLGIPRGYARSSEALGG